MLTRAIDPIEQRVLGALMEKERTTPEVYPLTVSALIAACNQKTNRHPVTELTEGQVIEALERLRKDVLVWRSEGARVERWEHRLGSRWRLDDAGEALMTLLLLRGAQTPGELRSRSDRLRAFASVGEVDETLQRLASGPDPLVRELARVPGQRETRWAHVMGTDDAEAAAVPSSDATPQRAVSKPAVGAAAAPRVAREPTLEDRVAALEERLAALEKLLS
jgi:uncharacterized protein YceH (UPF0502 family)